MTLSRSGLLSRTTGEIADLTLDAMSITARERAIHHVRDRRGDAVFLEELREFALRNLVGPIVAHVVLDALGEQAPAEWRAVHEASARRMATLLGQLDEVAAALAEHGIQMVALKNAGISRGIYPCAACCPMGDLDVVVDLARFREAHEIVQKTGFVHASRSVVEPAELEHGIESGGTEYVKSVDGEEVWFELQWRAVAGRWIRKDQEPDTPTLLARSEPIDGTDVRLLSPADNMLQVCLHTAKHSFVRAPGLRLHTDVDRLTAYQTPEWSRVIELAAHYKVETATYFSLAMARGLLETPVPDDVLGRLSPQVYRQRAFERWMRSVDVFEPEARKFSRPAMIAFHSMLYDTAKGWTASVLGTNEDELTWRNAPRHVRTGAHRVRDLATRYQR